MERRKFLKSCCYTAVGLPIASSLLQSCVGNYYATTKLEANRLVIARSEFWRIKNKKKINRSIVLVMHESSEFPISIYKIEEDKYVASLLKCTHKGCELNIGGGIYSCPCHGSEFTMTGKLLEGPAEEDLKTFKIEIDNENIYIS